ncbi:MAG: AMIN domain-containing protein [Nitrospirae bacterium]|nr:MAG: AMIN domain-containing protein [Nitrospirota bacterium]
MKTQLTSLGVLVAGAAMLGTLQACAPTEPMMEPTVAETAPTRSAQAPAREMAPPPADALKSAPESPAVKSKGEATPPSLIAARTTGDKLLPPARSMTDLTVQRAKDSVVVLITGDGELTYDVTKLSGNRLVIDLLNVANGTKRQAIPVQHQFMRQIRIGVHQFPQAKVRLVLDLRRTVPYTIEKIGASAGAGAAQIPRSVDAAGATETGSTVRFYHAGRHRAIHREADLSGLPGSGDQQRAPPDRRRQRSQHGCRGSGQGEGDAEAIERAVGSGARPDSQAEQPRADPRREHPMDRHPGQHHQAPG